MKSRRNLNIVSIVTSNPFLTFGRLSVKSVQHLFIFKVYPQSPFLEDFECEKFGLPRHRVLDFFRALSYH
jgi:hypothetical protein